MDRIRNHGTNHVKENIKKFESDLDLGVKNLVFYHYISRNWKTNNKYARLKIIMFCIPRKVGTY